MRIKTGAVIVALMMAPAAAFAQNDGAPNARLQGSPNAAGFGKNQGIDDTKPTAGALSNGDDVAPSARDLKGPPNANGYGK